MKRRGKGRVVILALLLAVLALAAAIALLCGVSTTGKGETYDAAFAEDRLRGGRGIGGYRQRFTARNVYLGNREKVD